MKAIATNPPAGPGITLHIEELVLHGVAPGDRHRIGDAVQEELHRMLTEQGLPRWLDGGTSIARLDGGQLPSHPHAAPSSFGAGIARAVYQATAPATGPTLPSAKAPGRSRTR